MNTIDKLNNTLGYLTAMSFDRPELSNDLVEPLNTLSEAISEVENLSLSGVSQQRELLIAFLTDNIHGNLYFTKEVAIKAVDEYLSNL